MPLVSVIMAAYNEPSELFGQALESILFQTYESLEIIVVLDKPDNQVLRECISAYSAIDKRVIPVWNDKNLGLAESLNQALGIANGEYICRMDSDDISSRDRIRLQLDYLLENKLDLVGAYVDVIDESGTFLYSVDNIPLTPRGVSRALRWNNCVPHPTWFGRREVFSDGYRMIPQSEDYDFLIRSVLHGYKVGNLPKMVLEYRQTPGSISRSNLYRQYLYQVELSKSYATGNILNLEQASGEIETHLNEKKKIGYSRANKEFNEGLSRFRAGNVLQALIKFAKIPVYSRSYCLKLIRMAFAALNA